MTAHHHRHRPGARHRPATGATPATAEPRARPSRGSSTTRGCIARRGPHPHEAPARAAERRHDPADHVRRAVRLRLRRRDPDPRLPRRAARYREFLMAGIMAQTLVFTRLRRGHEHRQRPKNQAIDRFRSLPIAQGRGARPATRWPTSSRRCCRSSSCRSPATSSAGASAGSMVDTVAAYGLAIAFAFAMIWVGVWLGSHGGHPRGRHRHRLRRDLPADVHRLDVRAPPGHARRRCAPSPSGTR